jgi:hypothetical protein
VGRFLPNGPEPAGRAATVGTAREREGTAGADRGLAVRGNDGPDVAVALQALESDARRWTDAAAVLRSAAAAAGEQELDPGTFSFAGRAVADAYEALRARTSALLVEGADDLDAVAAALRASARAYAAEEEAGAHRLGGDR